MPHYKQQSTTSYAGRQSNGLDISEISDNFCAGLSVTPDKETLHATASGFSGYAERHFETNTGILRLG